MKQNHGISSVASAIAARLIQNHLEKGGTVEIPSLGITIGGMMTNEEIALQISENVPGSEYDSVSDFYPIDIAALASLIKDALDLAEQRGAARAAILYKALNQIDRHVIGACESDSGGMPEPCDECGEMREIASQALEQYRATTPARFP